MSKRQFFDAIWNEDEHFIRQAVKNGFGLTQVEPESGLTLASVAAVGGTRILEVLLGLGADPNQPNTDGTTALTQAVLLVLDVPEEIGRVELLLTYGATIDAEQDGNSSHHRAAFAGHQELVTLLSKHSNKEVMDRFDYIGRTPLMCAIDGGHLKTATLLLDLDADINASDESQLDETALARAVAIGTSDQVDFLLTHGADPTRVPPPFLSCIEIAERRGDREREAIIRILRGDI